MAATELGEPTPTTGMTVAGDEVAEVSRDLASVLGTYAASLAWGSDEASHLLGTPG